MFFRHKKPAETDLKDQNEVWDKIFPNGIDMKNVPRYFSRKCYICKKPMDTAHVTFGEKELHLVCPRCNQACQHKM